jgi:hypothetical protein
MCDAEQRHAQLNKLVYSSGLIDQLFDPTTRTRQRLARSVRPTGEHQTGKLRGCFLSTLFRFALLEKAPAPAAFFMMLGVLGAAMLAQPSIPEIEKVIGFVQGEDQVSGVRCRVSAFGRFRQLKPGTRNLPAIVVRRCAGYRALRPNEPVMSFACRCAGSQF